ncbi:hypothetical protein ACOMCU_25010 [Lysinibacillus sp. UGB7]|uniref:hypothetical protein n=1 Tax=Lysinibacillus sp. UGB7 TaxID=3411039 RepID=UPI003B7B37F7
MTVMNALSLNALEQQTVVEKIKGRVTSKFNLAADFSKLKASKVDFAPGKVQTKAKEKMIGSLYSVPIKTFEGLDGEVQYVELNETYFYNVATKTKSTNLLKSLQQSTTTDNEKLGRIANHLTAEGYTIKKDEEYVIQNQKTAFEKEIETYSESTSLFIWPIYKNEIEIGLLAVDESSNIPVAFLGVERTFINEDNEIVTVQANTCSLTWAECMDQELCSGIIDCLIWASSCIGMCCGCLNPLICIGCVSCGVKIASAAWTCRMCVSNASRPNECPTK